jgi:hypothetical protein
VPLKGAPAIPADPVLPAVEQDQAIVQVGPVPVLTEPADAEGNCPIYWL